MRLMLVTAAVVALSACAARAGGSDVPYGHKDYYPTPERPVGFRGDGNGYFPGATPVSEWWEGTPVEREAEVRDRGRTRTIKYWDLADEKAHNIAFKTELPSWGNSQPIVVGDRIFTTGEPDLLICVDARSGKVLWSDRVNPWAAAGVDPAIAERCRAMYDCYTAVDRATTIEFHFNTCGRYLPADEYRPMIEAFAAKGLPRILADLARLDPECSYEGAAKETVEFLRSSLKEIDENPRAAEKMRSKRELRSLERLIEERTRKLSGIKMPFETPWGNMVGWAMSVPVSDGRHVFVSFGQGQSACYDLDGQRVWARWFEQKGLRTHHILSPLLAGDVFVDMHGGTDVLRGLSKATGEVLWESPTRSSEVPAGGGYYVGSHKVVSVGGVPYVVTNLCNILRASDGKVVGYLPFQDKPAGGPSVVSRGDLVLKGAVGDNYSAPYTGYRLKADGPEKVVAEKLWDLGDRSSPGYNGVVLMPGAVILTSKAGNVVDPITGKVLVEGSRGRPAFGGMSELVAGDKLIWLGSRNGDPMGNNWRNRRPDGKTFAEFCVADLSDPSNPKMMTDHNLLGGLNPPRCPAVEKYTPELYANPDYWNASGGKPAHFVWADTVWFPQGNRLFLRSVGYLYAIGDPTVPYDGPAAR